MLYGQFVGNWRTRTTAYLADGTQEHTEWDVRFSWVLEGRAVQDLWITPPARTAQVQGGTTPATATAPRSGFMSQRWTHGTSSGSTRRAGPFFVSSARVGHEIVQDGEADSEGRMTRWVYRDITASTFRWCNERSSDAGRSWTLLQEMRAYRI